MDRDQRKLQPLQGFTLGVSLMLAISAGSAATAQSFQPKVTPYRPAPSGESSKPAQAPEPVQAVQPAQPLRPTPAAQQATSAPAPVPASQAQAQAQPAPRKAQAPQTSAQTAASCMNESKSTEPDAAIRSCDAVIGETTKNLANAFYFRGIAKADKNDFDGAIGDYSQALKIDATDSDYLNSRAQAYAAKNDLDRALADYNQSIKTNPRSVFAYNSRGMAYQRKGDFARAAADYAEVTKLQPNNADAWNARVRCGR